MASQVPCHRCRTPVPAVASQQVLYLRPDGTWVTEHLPGQCRRRASAYERSRQREQREQRPRGPQATFTAVDEHLDFEGLAPEPDWVVPPADDLPPEGQEALRQWREMEAARMRAMTPEDLVKGTFNIY